MGGHNHMFTFFPERGSLMTVEELLRTGKPFQTSGCPGRRNDISACNRPYGDSMPGGIRSFPFALDARDVTLVRRQMQGADISSYDDS